ncbi:MAG TPA: YceH family protein [Arenimonas sp.]|nr:YceH family protein [Arenimonas sp.]HOZ03924.1 YceH family protein [Arenimonas sp.]HPO23572.1 YceH family protein [Arenimonas sp.]HPW33520.1 YceH family protein [Arenimonas sp.]
MSDAKLLLSAIEARILGCLIEKEATTPEQYPLTLNAIHLACNQKTNREPITEFSLGDVGHSMRQLDPRGLVRSQHGARAERYEHRVNTVFSLTKQQQALLCVLMLRGPQTLSELMTRTERLASFSDIDEVKHTLDRLSQREIPLVERIPRASGQREDRYVHLLCGPVDHSQLPAPKAAPALASNALEERIAQLEERLANVEQQLQQLKPA